MSVLAYPRPMEVYSVSAEVVAAVFGIAITVVAIIVQLAATRFNHQITLMFIRDPINLAMQGYFLLTTVVCIWVSVLPEVSHWVMYAVLVMVTLALLLLLPYFAYVFAFISPLNLIQRIGKAARQAVTKGQPKSALGAIDQLQDITRHAIDQGDRVIGLACVHTFAELFRFYRGANPHQHERWNDAQTLAQDADFSSLEQPAFEKLLASKLWFEVKILHQFLNIIWLAVPGMRDVAANVGIAVQQLAVSNLDNREVLDETLNAMNSFMRAALNARDARTSYHLLSRYRNIIEALLEAGDSDTASRASNYFVEYGQLAFQLQQPFILHVAAYDMAEIIKRAHADLPQILPALMEQFLSLDRSIHRESDREALLGIRRVQLQIAVFFIQVDEPTYVQQIVKDLSSESAADLTRLAEQFAKEERNLFWEFTPRGVNFGYLEPELRRHLPQLMDMITAD